MMIVKASKDSEAGKMPGEELLAAMGKYNDELMKAGVLLDLTGLHPSSKGARIKFWREAHRARWALCRDKGADWRLLADPGEVEGGGD